MQRMHLGKKPEAFTSTLKGICVHLKEHNKFEVCGV